MIFRRCITRRRGLRALVGAALLLLSRRSAAAGDARLACLFAHPASARAIGAAYLRAYPNASLDAGSVGVSLPSCSTATDLRSTITARVRDDFANDRVVIVDGWMLSATEARLCALIHLTA